MPHRHRATYWKATRITAGLAAAAALLLVTAIHPFAGLLNMVSFLGYPLGYYLAAQGAIILLIVLLFWVASYLDSADRQVHIDDRR